MLKEKESVSQENYNKLVSAVGQNDSYQYAYGYVEKNLIIINLIGHYAIGYNDQEIKVVEISKDGLKKGESLTFTREDDCKMNLYGKVCLANAAKKLKLTVPGVVPSMPGTRQLPINQMDQSFKLIEIVKGFKG